MVNEVAYDFTNPIKNLNLHAKNNTIEIATPDFLKYVQTVLWGTCLGYRDSKLVANSGFIYKNLLTTSEYWGGYLSANSAWVSTKNISSSNETHINSFKHLIKVHTYIQKNKNYNLNYN